jgi:hypothetical protein
MMAYPNTPSVNRVGASPLRQITLMAMTDVGHGQPLPLIEEAPIERLLLAQRSHPS